MGKKYSDTTRRSVYKTITWRIFSLVTTVLVVYLMTGDVTASFAIGGIDAVVKTVAYYYHERAWNGIHIGKKKIKKKKNVEQ